MYVVNIFVKFLSFSPPGLPSGLCDSEGSKFSQTWQLDFRAVIGWSKVHSMAILCIKWQRMPFSLQHSTYDWNSQIQTRQPCHLHFCLFSTAAASEWRGKNINCCIIFSFLCWSWIPWNLSFRYILFHEKRLQTMLWHLNARVNSHQRWKQTRFCVCFHLWCELTSKINVTEWQVSLNSCIWFTPVLPDPVGSRYVWEMQ